MKYVFSLAIMATALFVVPAFAEDGHVPQATLNRLGLGDIQVLSDEAGMEIRGQSGLASAWGRSIVSGILISPDTKNFVVGSSSNAGFSNAELAGFIDPFAAQSQISFVNLSLSTTPPPFNGLLMGGAGGSSIGTFR